MSGRLFQDLRQPTGVEHALVGVVHEQGPEVTDTVAELPGGEILILDDQHEVFGDGGADGGEAHLVRCIAEPHAREKGADVRSDRLY